MNKRFIPLIEKRPQVGQTVTIKIKHGETYIIEKGVYEGDDKFFYFADGKKNITYDVVEWAEVPYDKTHE